MGKALLVASGKGGTGKSSLCAGISSALASFGDSVLLIDGDAGMRNLDILLGVTDKVVFSFVDVAMGNVPLERAMVKCESKAGMLCLLTAPFSSDLSEMPYTGFEAMMSGVKQAFDWVIIDGPAGQDGSIGLFAPFADIGAIVATPDDSSLRCAERMASTLFLNGVNSVRLVVNRVKPRLIKRGYMKNIDDAMDMSGLPLLGIVPDDERVIMAAATGRPITADGAKRGAALAYMNMARRLRGTYTSLIRIR